MEHPGGFGKGRAHLCSPVRHDHVHLGKQSNGPKEPKKSGMGRGRYAMGRGEVSTTAAATAEAMTAGLRVLPRVVRVHGGDEEPMARLAR